MTSFGFNLSGCLKAFAFAGALALSGLVAPTTAKADVVYTVNAAFNDGEHLTGTFSLNIYGYIQTMNLITTAGPSLPGNSYTIPGSSSGIIPHDPPADGFFVYPVSNNLGTAVLQLMFDHALGDTGTYSIVGGLYGKSFECIGTNDCNTNGTLGPNKSIGTVRFVTEGIATAVPEPSTWAMMIMGFAGLGFLAHRRRGMPSAIG